MTPNEFVANALRTESRVDTIYVNEYILNDTLDAIVALSELLDQIKKNAFYGKPFNAAKINNAIATAALCISRIKRDHADSLSIEERTKRIPTNPRLFHAIIGVATESAELLQAISTTSNEVDRINILEELGDLNWYQAIAVDELQADMEHDVLDRVIAKLRARYPEKFTSECAINRNLEKERNVLEGKDQDNP